MKIFSALFLAASIILFGSLCSAQTMIDMKDEAGVKYKQADTEMNRIYKLACRGYRTQKGVCGVGLEERDSAQNHASSPEIIENGH